MSDRYTVYFKGTLKTESPFATSPEGCVGRNKEQLLPRMPVNVGGAFVDTPFIPATSIRGKLRRAAARVIQDRFQAAGEETTFADWLLWSVGGVKGTGGEDIDPRKRAEIIGKSAVLSVFGAGDSPAKSMVGAAFHIGPGIPDQQIEATLIKGARAHENRNPALLEILPASEMDLVNAYTAANRDRAALNRAKQGLERDLRAARKAVNEGKEPKADPEALQQQLNEATALLEEAENAQRALGSDNALGRPLPGYEVLPQGLEMPHMMQITLLSREYVGFALAALDEFALDPVIGAHVSDGCGRISARYDVFVREGRNSQVEALGRISYGGLDGLIVEGEWLQKCLQAWNSNQIVTADYRASA